MGLTDYTWGHILQTQANKCWFYAISASVILSLYSLSTFAGSIQGTPTSDDQATKVDKNKQRDTATTKNSTGNLRSETYQQLLIDCADLLIPGTALNWVPVDLVVLGVATMLSSVLAGQQLWLRLQAPDGR